MMLMTMTDDVGEATAISDSVVLDLAGGPYEEERNRERGLQWRGKEGWG